MQDNIILLTFDEQSKAYQAFSELKTAAADGRVKLITAAVIERDANGALDIRDACNDGAASDAPLVGTMLGALLGVLAGPLGVLALGATGAALGSLAAVDVAGTRLSLIEQFTRTLPPGTTAVVASVREAAVEVIDGIAQPLGAVVLRRPTDAVMQEVEAAVQAQEAAAQEARKVLRAKHRAEWHEKFDTWKDEVEGRISELGQKVKARLEGKK
ncbi:MAG: DUF1269 domain-containing protein [Pseudomonadota bacterium]|nr:DUF1269 domain-containing protein [Pseudomonadota bacterium]